MEGQRREVARRAPAWVPFLPHLSPSLAHLLPVPSGKGADEGLACGSLCLQHIQPLLQLLDVHLQVSVPGFGLL